MDFLPMSNQSSDNNANIGFCKTKLCRMCHIQEYPPLNRCNDEVLWLRSRSGCSLVAFAHASLGNMCAAEK